MSAVCWHDFAFGFSIGLILMCVVFIEMMHYLEKADAKKPGIHSDGV